MEAGQESALCGFEGHVTLAGVRVVLAKLVREGADSRVLQQKIVESFCPSPSRPDDEDQCFVDPTNSNIFVHLCPHRHTKSDYSRTF